MCVMCDIVCARVCLKKNHQIINSFRLRWYQIHWKLSECIMFRYIQCVDFVCFVIYLSFSLLSKFKKWKFYWNILSFVVLSSVDRRCCNVFFKYFQLLSVAYICATMSKMNRKSKNKINDKRALKCGIKLYIIMALPLIFVSFFHHRQFPIVSTVCGFVFWLFLCASCELILIKMYYIFHGYVHKFRMDVTGHISFEIINGTFFQSIRYMMQSLLYTFMYF